MSSPFFGGNEFFRQMLGDLLRMMPGGGSGIPWQFAYQLASEIAAGGGSDPNPDPIERIRFEELSRIAELHVSEITGMAVDPTASSVRLVPASRGDWARRTLDTWRPVLDRLAAVMQPPEPPGPTAVSGPTSWAAGSDLEATGRPGGVGDEGADEEDQMMALLGQWSSAMFPTMTAMQVGSVAGHLSEQALGTYDVPLAPAPGHELLVVSANVASLAEDWSLPLDDVRLWLAVHEIAYHSVLSRPAVAERLAALVVRHAELVRPDPAALQELLAGADPGDPESLARIFGDPQALASMGGGGPEIERIRGELDALTAAVAGYAEHVTRVAAGRLIGNQVPIGEAMRRRRVGRSDGEKAAEQLFGLSLDQPQIDRGERFVTGVLERSGDAELARVWNDEGHFPTPAEVDAPGLWLARINLPGDGGESGGDAEPGGDPHPGAGDAEASDENHEQE